MLEKFNDALFGDDDMNVINEGFNNVTFFGGEMGILSVDLDKINLFDVNFDEYDSENVRTF